MRTAIAFLLLTSSALAADMQTQRDMAYAESKNERQTLDVYAPTEGKDHPIVFWIHGGGWQAGSKEDVKTKPQFFVDKGFVFVSTNYRLLPEATIEQMGEDVAKSIRWVHDHAREYAGDPNRMFVIGHSAGAPLAALVCTDNRYLKFEGLTLSSIIKGCVPVDGDTYDVPTQIATVEERIANIYRRKFGDEASQKYEFDCSLGFGGLPNGQFLSASGRCEKDKGCTGRAQLAAADDTAGLCFIHNQKHVKND